jgi:transcription initiation factor TFIID TATA-box-binding protein
MNEHPAKGQGGLPVLSNAKNFRVVNVVASARLSQAVSLGSIAASLPGAAFDQEVFSGLVYRRQDPKATVVLFGNGKIVSTGTASTELAKLAIRRTLKDLEGLESTRLKLGRIVIVNLVAIADLGSTLALSDLYFAVPGSTYEPEGFPGLFMPKRGKSVVLVFGTGKVVCTGATSRGEARSTIEGVGKELGALGFLTGRTSPSAPGTLRLNRGKASPMDAAGSGVRGRQ